MKKAYESPVAELRCFQMNEDLMLNSGSVTGGTEPIPGGEDIDIPVLRSPKKDYQF